MNLIAYRCFQEIGLTEEVSPLNEPEIGLIVWINQSSSTGIYYVYSIRVPLLDVRNQCLVYLSHFGCFRKQFDPFGVLLLLDAISFLFFII